MSTFENIGFLAEDPSGIENELQRLFGEYLEVAKKLNEYAQAKQYELAPSRRSGTELLAAMLVSRTLSTYQGVLVLVQKGMKHQALIMLRSMYEPTFQIRALANDPSFLKAMIDDDLIRKKSGIQNLINYYNRNGIRGDEIEQAKTERIKLRKQLKDRDPRCKTGLSVRTLAKVAGMMDEYEVTYSHHSNSVHCSLLSVEEDIILDDDGMVVALRNEPRTDDIQLMLISAVELMCIVISAANQLLNLEVDEQLEELRQCNKDLAYAKANTE